MQENIAISTVYGRRRRANNMQAVKIKDNVFWVGAIDWNIRDFHGYSTNRGTTYNAYLILDEKVVLIDTVKKEFYPQMLARIKSILPSAKIDVLISNHSELDHSGSVPEALRDLRPQHFYASQKGVENLKAHLGSELPVSLIPDGGEIKSGAFTLQFFESRMLHWPDSMVCLLKEENIFFCNDIFGMHYASGERFDDQVPQEILAYEAKKYYANIILPYTNVVKVFLARIKKLGINPAMICPDHGPLWRSNSQKILALYEQFSSQKNLAKALVVYDTMWGSTAKMADSISDGLISQGIEVKQYCMHFSHRSDIATELLDSAALIIGSPVLNQEIYPSLADVFTYLKGLRKQGLLGAAFGSCGWSDMPLNNLEQILLSMQAKIIAPTLKARFVPTEEKLLECFNTGVLIAEKIKESV